MRLCHYVRPKPASYGKWPVTANTNVMFRGCWGRNMDAKSDMSETGKDVAAVLAVLDD